MSNAKRPSPTAKAQVFYDIDDFSRKGYWTDLVETLSRSSPVYGAVIGALRAHGGIVPRHFFPIVSGAPVNQPGKTDVNAVLSRLEALGLVEECVHDDLPCIALAANGLLHGARVSSLESRLLVQKIMLLGVADWAQKLNLAIRHKIQIRDLGEDLPTFGNYTFDLCGPSYLAPMTQLAQAGKPGFLVCDAIVDEVDENGIASFLHKCAMSASMRNLAPFLPVLVALGFSPAALELARSRGVVACTPDVLFGPDIADGLRTLQEVLDDPGKMASCNPGIAASLFDRFRRLEGAADSLRSPLFRLIVGHVVFREGKGAIEIGKKVYSPGEPTVEIDVFQVSGNRVLAVECGGTGLNSGIGDDEIAKWIKEKVPKIHKALQCQPGFLACKFRFEFWAAGSFTLEAERLAHCASREIEECDVVILNGAEVRDRISAVNSPALCRTFDEYFASRVGRHPS